MSDFSDKRQQALEACEKVINGIEDESISISSALLLCLKIARLVNDIDGQEWLGFEYGGYPTNEKGFITGEAWIIAKEHGRVFKDKKSTGIYTDSMFPELCSELEETIKSMQKALNNFTTQGFSAAGEYAAIATGNLTHAVTQQTNALLKSIKLSKKRLSILKSQYYEYALKWKIELSFGHLTKTIFESYQIKIDQYYSALPKSILLKVSTIEDMMRDGNSERYAQVLTSCRRLWSDVSKQLFEETFPAYSSDTFTARDGTKLKILGNHDNNRLSAVIEKLQSKAAKNTLVGSEIFYLIDWLEQINDNQNAGVHSEVTEEQAMRGIIHTYIALGDILSLKAEAEQSSSGQDGA